MSETGSNADTDSLDDEFFDAEDKTPKSRGNSMKRTAAAIHNPTVKVSVPVRPDSLAFELLDDYKKDDVVSDPIHPDEITQELEALSKVDDERLSRIAKLEKLRRGEERLHEEHDESVLEDHNPKPVHPGATALPESAESSVEGISIGGAKRYPFKVIEPEPDRRSVCSETRSNQGRSSQGRSYEHSTRGDSVPKSMHEVVQKESISYASGAGLQAQVPDIVSSMIKTNTEATPVPSQEPLRPPRRKSSQRLKNISSPITETKSYETDHNPQPLLLSKKHRGQEAHPVNVNTKHNNIVSNKNMSTPTSVFNFHGNISPTTTSTPRSLHDQSSSSDHPIPSPASTVASLTRDLEDTLHNLDLEAAQRGLYVVKPQDDEKSRGETLKPIHHHHVPLLQSLSTEDEPVAPLKSPREESPDRNPINKFQSMDRKSIKSVGAGGSGGRRSSSALGPVNSQSLGSNYTSATSGSSSGGKRSLQSGGSIDSSGVRDQSGLTKQMNLFLRTKSDSGKRLSDAEILKQIKVKNLDTGQEMNLEDAETHLPDSINPLSLHIMRLTSEYVSGDHSVSRDDSDTVSMVSSVSGYTLGGGKKKKSGIQKFFGSVTKKTSDVARSIAKEATLSSVSKKKSGKDSIVSSSDVEKLGRLATEIKSSEGVPDPSRDGKGLIFKRIQAHKSGPFDFEDIKFAQELSQPHLGPIWCMKFSQCGQLLATAGQDTKLRIWVLKNSYSYFDEMRNRYNADVKSSSSPTNSYENVILDQMTSEEKAHQVFMERPFCEYSGHTSDLLDVSWSKNYFILTSSMDKTVRLWHISRKECLCCFQHIDFVTAICFHPRNDQFFLSGSLDGKLRLWNIPDKKVALWNEVTDGASKLITTANFIQNGKFAVVGTYDGRCIFYSTDMLKYYTMIHVRSARGKNAQGRKVTGIEPMPGEDKLLVTSNDSRIRLYDLRDLTLSCKYKGYANSSSQIRASFSHDGKYITAGSENQCVFLWRTHYEPNNLSVSRKDRNDHYEAIKAHNAVVTQSVFAPVPQLVFDQLEQNSGDPLNQQQQPADDSRSETKFNASSSGNTSFKKDKSKDANKTNPGPGYVIISGDYDGEIKVFLNAVKPKHSSLP